MKNAIISLILFLALLSSVIFINNLVLNLCDEIGSKADEIESIMLSDDYETAYSKSAELLDFLKDNDLLTSVYVNHQDFDSLKIETARLCVYISHDDLGEAYASLHNIKFGAETVKHLQKPGIDNIF